ncbi:hypothetical protein DSC45_03570 [Streptomyces sp. YIM 130001]|uniref:DUF6777 domain-containing protein n=1 Tax=Streptomyces sp. YIM 130001 TaxID=2259644 RepID=UPI000EDF5EC5|nr:DUF6777 domain-containing protein [Streptomyces sp. YIM 130001]RII20280.1 hypothetical protein DSC45_03570 [Streptomyces sp. YIM 130001]
MRPTRRRAKAFAIPTALAASAAFALAGCSAGGQTGVAAASDQELFLEPVAAEGSDPFTDSTAAQSATPPPVTRSPQPNDSGTSNQEGTRSLSGDTPGLYGGTKSVSSCDVEKQIRYLTAHSAKATAFAETVGISSSEVTGYLRGLTPVQLRADTRITNHGFRSGSANAFQSVMQAGTAVLVDNRGLPRVRCACGNPLTPPVQLNGSPRHQGKQWPGYQVNQVVVINQSTQVINNITLVNVTNNTWIERPIGDDGRRDKPVPPPSPTPDDDPTDPDDDTTEPDDDTTEPDDDTTGPDDQSTDPDDDTTDPDDSTDPDDPDASVNPDDPTATDDPDQQDSDGQSDPDGLDDQESPDAQDDSPAPDESADRSPDGTTDQNSPADCPTVLPTGPDGAALPIPDGCPTPQPGAGRS